MQSSIAIPEGQSPEQVRAEHMASEKSARYAGLVCHVFAALMLPLVIILPFALSARYETAGVVFFTGFALTIAVVYFLLGRALRSLKSWARSAAVLAAILLLPGIPVGTMFGVLILYFVLRADRFVFSRTYQDVIAATAVAQ
jgi:hypothetical protein